MLFADRPKTRQLGRDVLADLDRGRDQHGAKAGAVIDHQLCARVMAEDRVLHPAAGGRDEEALPIPVEPVRAQMRAAVSADPGHDHVPRLSQKRRDLVRRCHTRHRSCQPPPAPRRPARRSASARMPVNEARTAASQAGATRSAHHCPAIPKSVPNSPEYASVVTPLCSVRENSSLTWGTGPRTSQKLTRSGRSKVTVSTVVAVSRPWCTGV